MFGIAMGAACLFGFIWLWRRPHALGGRWGRVRSECRADFSPRGVSSRHSTQKWALRWLYRQLDTTPGQERVIRESTGNVLSKLEGLRDEWQRAREELSKALREEVVSAEALSELGARCDNASIELRMEVGEALAQIHEVLEPEQRERLAELIDAGDFRRHFNGPYRAAV